MKKIIVIILLINLFGCKGFKADGVINSTQFVDVLQKSILTSCITSDKIFLYEEYENRENIDSIVAFYHYGSNIWKYEVSDSIIDNIEKRGNKHLPDSIDVLSVADIKLISDTSNFNKDYILISEPFFVDQSKLLFVLSNKNNITSLNDRWIFYMEMNHETYELISFYNFQNDKFYFPAEL